MLIRWLNEAGIEHSNVEPASADASFRRYFRVYTGKDSLIAVDTPPEHNDNPQFIDIASRLSDAGIHTPEIIRYSLENGYLLLEDFGTEVLQQALETADHNQTVRLYTDAISSITSMQQTAATKGLPLYNEQLLRTEMQLFTDWYLQQHLHYTPSNAELNTIEEVFTLCVNNAIEQPQAFVHRDYHCRNLMPTRNTMGIIDFQDAVLGPVTYDPVSLLKDVYLDWPEEFIAKFSNQHRLSLQPMPDIAQYTRWFDLMGLQRHIKVLGIFCRLNYRDGKAQYLNDLPLVLLHVVRTIGKYPELKKFLQLIKTITAKTEKTKA